MASRTISRSDVLHGNLFALEVRHHILLCEDLTRLEHDNCAGALAQALVRVGHHRSHGNGRMAVQQGFHFNHGNVLTAANNHVLTTTGDAHIALGIQGGQVAGVKPAFGIGAVQMRALQVAPKVGAGAQIQFAEAWPAGKVLPSVSTIFSSTAG